MKTKKKFLTILLTVCLVMAMIPMTVLAADEVQDSDTWDGSVATAFAGGTGAAEDFQWGRTGISCKCGK